MNTFIFAALLALTAGFAVAAIWQGWHLWCAALREERTLRMHRVFERKGITLEGCTDHSTLAKTAAAARRCLLCRERETCLAWLEGVSSVALEHFCPNADLVAKLEADAWSGRLPKQVRSSS